MNKYIFLILLLGRSVFGTTYWVDAQAGNNGSAGTDSTTAWRTAGYLDSQWANGDSALFAGFFGNDSLDADFERSTSGIGSNPDVIFETSVSNVYVGKWPDRPMPTFWCGDGNTYDAYGIILHNVDSVIIDSVIVKRTNRGIYIQQSSYCVIEHSTVCTTAINTNVAGAECSNNSGGIVFWQGEMETGNRVTGCTLFRNMDCNESGDVNSHGIAAYRQHNLIVESCLVYEVIAGYGIRFKVGDTGCVARYNTVHDAHYGFEFGTANDRDTAHHNIIYNTQNHGMYALWKSDPWDPTTNVVFYNNTVYNILGAEGGGINIGIDEALADLDEITGFEVFNNIVVDYNIATQLAFEITVEAHTGGYADYNNYFNNSTSDVVDYKNTELTLAEWLTTCAGLTSDTMTGCDSNSVSSDPGFIDAAGGDFRIYDNVAAATGGRGAPWDTYMGALVPVAAVTRRIITSGNTDISGSVIITGDY